MKALFVGLGSIGQRHLRNLKAIVGDNLEISAYRVTRTAPVLNSVMQVVTDAKHKDHYDIKEFDNLDKALANKPDIVFVTNPNSHHMEVALKAANAGCHLLIEKPLATSLDEVEQLKAVVKEKNLVAMVAYQFRFHPGLQLVKKWLQTGHLGRLVSARMTHGEYMPGWHPYEDYRDTYAARSELGGGTLVTQIHEFDVALWLFGLPKSVFAVGGHLSNLDIDVEDCVTSLLSCQWQQRPLPVTIELDYLRKPAVKELSIIGDEGSLLLNFSKNELSLNIREGDIHEVKSFASLERNQLFIDEMQHFLNAIKNKEQPVVDLHLGAQSLQIALGARQSLQSGQVEFLTPIQAL
ncbi:MAG: Gfo/Idh/MocA family oxidoreductase [Magnetococcales bacterium]|nr:Gfo/Idh/MocA family oxidoreductase [Magnetococcales bacterium]